MISNELIEKSLTEYQNQIFRMVESQYHISTMKLVDGDYDVQRLLEEILDDAKPPYPCSNSNGKLHYLLFTPFRYPPLNNGGRFHTATQQSIFYGSETIEAAIAERTYVLRRFITDSEAKFEPTNVPHTQFSVEVSSAKSILLSKPPFASLKDRISDPNSYSYSQSIGSKLRNANVELLTYFSARKPLAVNVGLISPEAFASNMPSPDSEKSWNAYLDNDVVEFIPLTLF